MKKTLLIMSTCLMAIAAMAQVQPGDTAYSVSVHAGYAHNLTYGSYANFDLAFKKEILSDFKYEKKRFF